MKELGAYQSRTIYEGEDIGSVIKEVDTMAKNKQGSKPPVPVVDGSQVGSATNLDIPTQRDRTKTDKASAAIQTTPEASQTKVSGDDFANQLFSGIPEDQRNMFIEAFNGANKSGTFTQASEKVLQNLLGTQLDQSKMKKERGRLMEEANLPELESELAQITSNYDTLEAARNSRLVNETASGQGMTKRVIQAQQSEIQRQYGLQVADNRISELATAGKINAATKLVDAKLNLRFGDLESEIELYQSQLNAITPFMNQEQSKLAEQRQFILKQASQEIEASREKEKTVMLQKVEALKNAQERGASAMQIAKIQDAQSLEEIASTGFLTSAMEKAQLSTEYLQQENIRSQISDRAASALTRKTEFKDTQTKDAAYAVRTEEADKTLSGLESVAVQPIGYLAKVLPNIFKTPERQKIEQAERNFINATLRKESGAVISPEEFDNARKQYIPQPGDVAETLEQKRVNRNAVISSLKTGAGDAYDAVQAEIANTVTEPEPTRTDLDYLKLIGY